MCFLQDVSCMKLLAGALFQDGETASIFPNHTSANYIQKYVLLSAMINSILSISTCSFSHSDHYFEIISHTFGKFYLDYFHGSEFLGYFLAAQ